MSPERRPSRWRPGPERERVAGEVDEEIELHLAMRTADMMREGLSEAEARAEALRRFGWNERTRAGLRAEAMKRERRMRTRGWLDGVAHDASEAVRTAFREPGLSGLIVVTLALGIGTNAAMFGLIDRLLLRGPAHVQQVEELFRLYLRAPSRTGDISVRSGLGYASYTAFRDGTHSFDGVAAYAPATGTLGTGMSAESISMVAATADFFPALGVRAYRGRFPGAGDDRPPVGENVVVLGYDLWLRRYGADPNVLGTTLSLDDQIFTVIGVAPRAFTGVGLSPVDVWIPMSTYSHNVTDDWPVTWKAQWLRVIGRLTPGVTIAQAEDDATAAHRTAYAGDSDGVRRASVIVRPVRYDTRAREPLEVVVSRWLFGVATVVLLIACANVMNLLLARTMRRRRDLAVRLALGIGRGRLIRSLLIHSLTLTVTAGTVALVVVSFLGDEVRRLLLPEVGWSGPAVDTHTLAFTLLAVVSTAVLTSLVPALRAGRRNLTNELKTGPSQGGGRRSWLRGTLTLGQITLTFVLMIAAGLFARSLATVQSIDLGIEPDSVIAISARLGEPAAGEGTQAVDESQGVDPRTAALRRRTAFYAEAVERVRGIPGVAYAAVAVGTPFHSSFTMGLRVSGHDSIPQMEGGGPYIAAVTDGFFETTGLDLLEGRLITAADVSTADPVAVVNRTMANTLWPDGSIGECLYVTDFGEDAPCQRVVGVVEDAHRFGLREPPAMQYYIPKGQESGFGGALLLVRPTGRGYDPQLTRAIRAALFELEPSIAYVRVESLRDEIDPQVRPWQLGASLFSLFGGLALLIAAFGLYGVISYVVVDRTHEMGVRKALGASRIAVLSLVLRHGAGLVAVGIALGSGVALLVGGLIQPALFETSARDPAVFAAVAVVTVVVSALASVVPAWRASRIHPVISLQAD